MFLNKYGFYSEISNISNWIKMFYNLQTEMLVVIATDSWQEYLY